MPTSSVGSGSPAGATAPASPSFGPEFSTAPTLKMAGNPHPNKQTEMFPPPGPLRVKERKALRAMPATFPSVPGRSFGPWRSSGTTSFRGPRSARPGGRRSSRPWARRCTAPSARAGSKPGASLPGSWASFWPGSRNGGDWAWTSRPQGAGRSGPCARASGPWSSSGSAGKPRRNSSGN